MVFEFPARLILAVSQKVKYDGVLSAGSYVGVKSNQSYALLN